jgi:hypothetical protein
MKYALDPAFDKGAIGFIFDFNITESNSASADLQFGKTFPSGAFGLKLAPSSSLTRQAVRKFTTVDTFGELKSLQPFCSPETIQANFPYPIAGSIGLDEVIRTAIELDNLGLESAGVGSLGGLTAAFSDELIYTTMFDTGAIAPSVSLNAVPGVFRLASASASLQATRQDIHHLTLAIALPNPPPSTPKGELRMKSRAIPVAQMILGSRGVPSKVLIHGTADPKVRVLWELDRRVLLGQEDRLINALSGAIHP